MQKIKIIQIAKRAQIWEKEMKEMEIVEKSANWEEAQLQNKTEDNQSTDQANRENPEVEEYVSEESEKTKSNQKQKKWGITRTISCEEVKIKSSKEMAKTIFYKVLDIQTYTVERQNWEKKSVVAWMQRRKKLEKVLEQSATFWFSTN